MITSKPSIDPMDRTTGAEQQHAGWEAIHVAMASSGNEETQVRALTGTKQY